MKITLIAVMSLDGKLTKWEESNIYEWSSPEDATHFLKVKAKNNLIIMGSGTFDVVRPHPEQGTLRIVMTTRPETYRKYGVLGQLEFTNENPKELVERLEQKGYKQLLLVGGKKIVTSFFQARLIHEVLLTIEPRIFGTGAWLVAEKMDVALRLIEMKTLNTSGTLLLKYRTVKRK